ncbi:hypothetical protein ANN_01348 [Periplaneta americana]|uniref:Mariner Mos1 transposase n=1 Tax=Periplaneta americana TaxID=6978 RepID=A0ABQ8TVR3_PERAM|nr:hypothetical protein ANN_01348 [Periplaneta americana]
MNMYDDDPLTDNQHQREIRELMNEEINTEDDREFTQEEIIRVLKKFDPKKAPGEDGLTIPKRQSSEWKSKTSPRKQKFPRDTSKGKVMLQVFFDSQGLIHHEFIPEGRTVTKELYVEIFRRLLDAVRRKRPEKWVENNWFLMHDNAPAHRAIIVKNFLARHNITALDHPPYSPDLSPPDYFLFPRLKSHLKGRRFNAEEVIANATRALRRVSQNGFQPTSRNSTRVGKSVLLRKATILKGILWNSV